MDQKGVSINGVDPIFADADSPFDEAKYVLFGVPFDATSSHITGASQAPAAIRSETYNFETFLMDLGVEIRDIPICDLGDLELINEEAHQEEVLKDVLSVSERIFGAEKMPIMMGGEHSLTEPAVDAFMGKYRSKGGTVIAIDAHLDFREEYQGNPRSHACVTRRIFEKWGPDSISVIGPRSGCREEYRDAREMGLRYATSQEVRAASIFDILDSWESAFSVRNRPIYLSMDMDGIDPAYAPGVGTPEPWGLTSWDILHLIEGIGDNVLAMDVVEVSPEVERYITPGLAGKLIRQIIGYRERTVRNPTWLEHI